MRYTIKVYVNRVELWSGDTHICTLRTVPQVENYLSSRGLLRGAKLEYRYFDFKGNETK